MTSDNHYLKDELYKLLQETPQFFEFLQKGSLDGIWYWDLEHPEHEWMSPQFWETLGYDPEAMPHRASEWQQRIAPDDLRMALDNLGKHLADPDFPYDQVVRYRHKDGSVVWIRCRGMAIRDDAGKPVRMLGAHTDLTAQKLTEEALRRSEEKYRSLFNHAGIGMFRSTIDGSTLIDANEKFVEIFGSTREAMVGAPMTPYWADIRERNTMVERLEAEGRIADFECRMLNANGEVRQCLTSLRYFPGQGLLEGSIIDITERKLAEQALIGSESRLRTLVKTIPDLVWLKDKNGIYLGCNPTFERFFGAAEGDILGKTDYDFVDKELADSFRAHDLKAMQLGHPSLNEEEITFAADGYRGLFETIKTPMLDDDGSLIGVLGIARDISDRKKAETEKIALERKLRQSQKMEAIGTLAGGIAHDFNNILSSVIGFTELALDDAPEGSSLEDNLKEVFRAGKRAKDLVNQILTFARQKEGEKKPVQVNLIAIEVLHLLRSSIPTTIRIDSDIRSKAMVMADPGQIHQIFLNLCTNAAQAMEMEAGVLRVGVTDLTLDHNLRTGNTTVKPGRYIRITVADTGPGIPKAHLIKIFEPYFTTKTVGAGTGLGLAVVHGAAAGIGGEVAVESELGKGTTFTVFLPATTMPVDAPPRDAGALPGGDEHILFVDDEAPITKASRRILERLGYSVTTASSGAQALEAFRSAPRNVDLVITDMTMPDLTGDKLAVELMAIRSDIPVILCTGYSKRISEEAALALGIRAFIYKPIAKADMARTVRNVLDEAATSG